MSKSASFVFGIDLGTTNFAISVIRNGRPHMIEDAQQNRTFPSAVFRKNGQWEVGYPAKTARLKEPHLGAYAVKRLMGLHFDSEERPKLAEALGLTIVPLKDGFCGVQLGEEVFTPSDIAAEILRFSYNMVQQQFGQKPDEVVITVPAYFNHSQRNATKLAAEKAGLPCQRIINEPTAAAIAYGMRVSQQTKVVVFDLGGGTFDISILQFAAGIVETLAISGDSFLGGEDIDNALVHHCLKHIEDRNGVDISGNRVSLRRLKEACETAKCELSYQQSTMIMLPQLYPNIDFQITLSRNLLVSLVEPLVNRAMKIVEEALSDASLKVADIDKVILVGGQTRMPYIRERLATYFKQEPSKGVHPDEVVAKGAALHAASLLGEVDAPMLFDVTPFDLGIDVQAGLFQTIVAKNARIPVSASKRFVLNQGKRNVTIVVRQGHSRFSAENEFLGEFRVANLELRGDGVAELNIAFRLDGNGMLHVTAKDVVSGRSVEMKMRNYGEFIRADEEFETHVTQEKAQIGVGDSSASRKGKNLTVQVHHHEDASYQADTSQDIAKKMRDLMQNVDKEDELEEISPIGTVEGSADGEDAVVFLSPDEALNGIPSEEVDENVLPSNVPIATDAEESSEEVFELVAEDEEVILLGDALQMGAQVQEANLAEANDALEQLLNAGYQNELFLPEDDFFAGLTAAVTGQDIQTVLGSILNSKDSKADQHGEEVSKLSPEMRMVLEELFLEL